jgi:hypothetical protein
MVNPSSAPSQQQAYADFRCTDEQRRGAVLLVRQINWIQQRRLPLSRSNPKAPGHDVERTKHALFVVTISTLYGTVAGQVGMCVLL